MMVAWQDGHLSDDIAEEQHKLEQAELVIFQVIVSQCCTVTNVRVYISLLSQKIIRFGLYLQFPLYWFSIPGIMKGWIDRVLTQGFAFTLEKMYDNGIFKV